MSLSGQVALVTGGGTGIGKAIAQAMLAEGAKTIIVGRKEEVLKKAQTELGSGVEIMVCDVTQEDQVDEVYKNIMSSHGRFDILINNAGITKDNLLLRMDYESWKKVLDINLNSCFNLTKAAVKEFLKKKKGSIINISSIVGIKGNAGQSNYAASKGGINSFTKSIALELGSRNIRCNAIAPGFIETEMTDQIDKKNLNNWINSIPLKRAGSVEDVANLCCFLGSDKSSYITGQIIKVDGGLLT